MTDREQTRRDAGLPDREKIRREAQGWIDADAGSAAKTGLDLAEYCQALLFEVEQSERNAARLIQMLAEPCAECGHVDWRELDSQGAENITGETITLMERDD